MKKYQLIVFDWLGTLVDPIAVLVGSIEQAAKDVGLPTPSTTDVLTSARKGFSGLAYGLYPNIGPVKFQTFQQRYRHYQYKNLTDAKPVFFPGVEETLRELKNQQYLLAIASSKSRSGVEQALSMSAMGSMFDAIRSGDECLPKPDKDMLEQLMNELVIEAKHVLMVGDSGCDLLMAKAANIDAIAVGYGSSSPDDLESYHPKACLTDIRELTNWL